MHATLETLYPADVWQRAERRGHLIRRNAAKVCPPDLTNRIILGEARLEDSLDPAWAYLVTHDFAPGHKVATAERICRQDDDRCRVTLAAFQPVLREALTFLGVDP